MVVLLPRHNDKKNYNDRTEEGYLSQIVFCRSVDMAPSYWYYPST